MMWRLRRWYVYWHVKRNLRRFSRWLPFIGPVLRFKDTLEFEQYELDMSIKEIVDYEGWKRKVFRVR